MEKEHLHLLIHEEIYRLSSDELIEDLGGKGLGEEAMKAKGETVEDIPKVTQPEPETTSSDKSEEESTQESPEIPIHKVDEPKELPFAVFHSSTDAAEIELLHKIIDACKISEDNYKIFNEGFDQSIRFKKALVFVPEAKAFYTPIPYKSSEFLCSKPLSLLIKDQNEKARLWGSLQKFI